MHEVGHTLGLRHNFRASTVYTLAQLDDPAFTAANGIVGLGDGVQRGEHRRQGRAAGRVHDDDARSVRLLGDRVRVQGDPVRRRRSRRARAHRRARQRARARLRDRRGRVARRSTRRRTRPTWAATRSISRVAASRCRRRCGTAGRTSRSRPARAIVVYRRVVERGLVAITGASAQRRQVRRRRHHAARPRGQPARAAHAGRRRAAARGAQDPRRRPVLRRQLPVQAGVHAPDAGRLARPQRHVRRRPVDAGYRLLAQHAGAERAAQGAEPADERRRRAAGPRQRGRS